MKNTPLLLPSAVAAFLSFASTSSHAALIAGVDFENAGDTAFDNSPDDLIGGDGVTVSSGWTVTAGEGVNNDANANNAGTTSGSFVAKLNSGSGGALPANTPTDAHYSWTLTIDNQTSLDLTNVTFDIRAGTGADSRWGMFNTSLDGGPGTAPLWSLAPLLGRDSNPNWTNVSVDLTDAKYKNLTDETVTFYWYAGSTGDDIDTILVSGTTSAIPEPSAFALFGLGLLGAALRRRR